MKVMDNLFTFCGHNGECRRKHIKLDKLVKNQASFLRELKKQIPGLTLSASNLHNKVKEIEKILDESISF